MTRATSKKHRPRRCPGSLLLALGWAIGVFVGSSAVSIQAQARPPASAQPNILYILADDLGYGDVHALNLDGKIPTPNLDRLASQGMSFTDAHSGSAVCTPTRYGILTGRYAWRTRLARGVLGGYSPPLIEPDRLTVAALLKKYGYHTTGIGKWHLGLEWPLKPGASLEVGDAIDPKGDPWQVDYAGKIRGGPNALGFDHFFGISASLDMPPYLYIEDDHCVGLPTTEKTYIRTGPAHADFEAVNVLPDLTDYALAELDELAAQPRSPFFLYLALTAPHTPIVPTETFQGRSDINPYADFVIQVDAAVGRVLEALDRLDLADQTLVVFTSDNGCSPSADFKTLAEHGHDPSHVFRGTKADIFEGGHRIPFLARWPGRVEPGSTCDRTVSLTDLMATCADILDTDLPDAAGEDSVSLLPALLGDADSPLREATVHHSIDGSFAIRRGRWKLCLCPGSGGWSAPRPGSPAEEGLPPVQLYDLEADIAEAHNVQAVHPEIVADLTALLERYVAEGRSTPGVRQPNDRVVRIADAEL